MTDQPKTAFERACEALFNRHIYGGYNAETRAHRWMMERSSWEADVRAVLTAIREPDDATEAAGDLICEREVVCSSHVFQAMIDHILKAP